MTFTQINWFKKLRELNPKLRVCQFENSRNLPGIYYMGYEGIVDVCATDLEWVPPMPVFDKNGFVVKAGYRRVVFILLHLKLTTRETVKKVLGGGFFESHYPYLKPSQTRSIHGQWAEMMQDERKRKSLLGDIQGSPDIADPLLDKMRQMEIDNNYRRGQASLTGDQFVELAAEVKEKMTDDQLENLDKAKFNYDKAVGKTKSHI